jgi:ceramide glucosyltransferase
MVAARRYLTARPVHAAQSTPISLLKPLAGVDDGLEENLRTFFRQDHPAYEVLFAVRLATDPVIAVANRVAAAFPHIPSRLIVTGEPPYPNAKVYSLDLMMRAAAHDVVVMSDSDTCAERNMLSTIAAEFADPKLGISTCPYTAVAGPSIWSRLEAVGMNTEFIGGVLVARMLEGMKFALGPTIAARKQALASIGGFDRLKDYLAEDFVMGKFADEAGWHVILSSCVIEHRIGSESFRKNLTHRLRWMRSTRRSRPAGYIGQVFTNPIPLAILLWAVSPTWWPVLPITFLIRLAAAWATSQWVLHSSLNIAMLIGQDLLSFAFWLAGFFGNTISWRGRRYLLLSDGRFELIP